MDYSIQKDITISLNSNGNTKQFFIENILYIESKNNTVTVYIDNVETENISNTIIEIENKLQDYCFYKINRNIIVNLRYFENTESTTKRCFFLKTGKKMTVSRRKWCEFKQNIK